LDLIDAMLSIAQSYQPFSIDDAFDRTLRYRQPSQFDPLLDWLEVHDLKLLRVVDAILPGAVARRIICQAEDDGWRDPVEWVSLGLPPEPDHTVLDEFPMLRPWQQLEGEDYERWRRDLLSIVENVRRRIGDGAPLSIQHPDSTQSVACDADWVPASSLFDEALVDATAVRRFCELHKVPMRQGLKKDGSPHKRRREVLRPVFAVVRARARLIERRLENVADRAITERQRRQDS